MKFLLFTQGPLVDNTIHNMADDATESEIKLSKINVPSNLLDTFWTLAEGSEEVRIKCSADVVDILKELQGSVIIMNFL